MKPFKKILVPTDFSECAEEAATAAVDLAERFGAAVTLLHAHMPPVASVADGGAFIPGPDALAQLAEDARKSLEALKARLARHGVSIDSVSTYGPNSDTIVRYAREGGYDLIVMGTHGRTGLKHLVLGSVAERVVRTAACPVMTVRHPTAPPRSAFTSPPLL